MTNARTRYILVRVLSAIAFTVVLVLTAVFGGGFAAPAAYAAEGTAYSNVLDDLQKDGAFKVPKTVE